MSQVRKIPISNKLTSDDKVKLLTLPENISGNVNNYGITISDEDIYILNANDFLAYKIQINHITEFNITGTYQNDILYKIILYIINGGSNAVIWQSKIKWSGNSPPSLSLSGLDIIVFTTIDGGTTWQASYAGKEYT